MDSSPATLDLHLSSPLAIPSGVVLEHEGSILLGYRQESPLIAKIDTRRIGHGSIENNIREINQFRALREALAAELASRGSAPAIIPLTHYVIHRDAHITYFRVQEWYVDSSPLSKVRVNELWRLPETSLLDLRNIFQIYLEYLEKGRDIEVIGFHFQNHSWIDKITRAWCSLFWSENIIIDRDNIPRFIDFGIWGDEAHRGLRGLAWKRLQKLRSWSAVKVINFILRARRLPRLKTIPKTLS
jgi:hypothetical protein